MKYAYLLLFTLSLFTLHAQDSTTIKLQHYKEMYQQGLINQQEYEALKAKYLDIVKIVRTDTVSPAQADKLYHKGELDAEHNYTRKSGVFGGTFVTTFFFTPVIGLIPTIACSSSAIPREHLDYPDAKLFTDLNYQMGYTARARRMKKDAAWTGWGAAFLIDAIVYTVTGVLVHKKVEENKK